jgi:hypothetical protein
VTDDEQTGDAHSADLTELLTSVGGAAGPAFIAPAVAPVRAPRLQQRRQRQRELLP